MYLDYISPPAVQLQTHRISHSAMKSISCQARQSSEGCWGRVCVTAASPDNECFKILQAIRAETTNGFNDSNRLKIYIYIQLPLFWIRGLVFRLHNFALIPHLCLRRTLILMHVMDNFQQILSFLDFFQLFKMVLKWRTKCLSFSSMRFTLHTLTIYFNIVK